MNELLAIIEVAPHLAVQCQEPGCARPVYKRIHIVKEEGGLIVLGSTCFEKRFGSMGTLGSAHFGNGDGRKLTEDERQLLISNTQKLLEQFEKERELSRAAAAKRLHEMRVIANQRATAKWSSITSAETGSAGNTAPWKWAGQYKSMAYFRLLDDTGWTRVQHENQQQYLMPYPAFDGWDEALPETVGIPSMEIGGYTLSNVPVALAYLRERASWEKIGSWRDIAIEINRRRPKP